MVACVVSTLVSVVVIITACFVSPVVSYDTIVVGLGSAGTTAASTLARAGRRVLALEAQDRVGGRVWTRPFGDGVVEAGAEWIHGQFPSRVYDLAVQNNVQVTFQDDQPAVHRSDGSASEKLSDLLGYSVAIMLEGSDINESMKDFIEKTLREYLRIADPGFLNDNSSLDSFLQLMDLMVDNFEASNSWKDVTALKADRLLQGSQNGSWNRYGYITFLEILLNIYNNGPGLPTLDIKLNKEVTNIQWPQQSTGSVVVTCKDGDQYSATNVIVTVSLGVLKERHSNLFTPPLPEDKVAPIEVLSIGVVDKIILLFDKPTIPHDVMFYWIAEDKEQVANEDRWITKILGTSVPAGSNNTLTLWLNGDNAKLVETLPEEVVKTKVVELLQRFVGSDVTVTQPVDLIRTTWFSNPFTRGSYSYDSLESAKCSGLRATLAAPLTDAAGTPRVLFAGEATDTTHYSTVHGASDSGYREAQRLLASATCDKLPPFVTRWG